MYDVLGEQKQWSEKYNLKNREEFNTKKDLKFRQQGTKHFPD